MPNRMRLSFGIFLAISGLALGVPGEAPNRPIGALMLQGGGPTWQTTGGQAGSSYGRALASAGDVNGDGFDDLIVGAPDYNVPTLPNPHEGRAFVYLGSALGPATQPVWIADGAQLGFGTSVASAGDVNGDGFDDVIVGEPNAVLGPPGMPPQWWGQASLYFGSPSGPAQAPAWVGHAGLFDYFGASVASAGDVNRDGYDDVIVGAPADPTRPTAHAFLYLGSPTGLPQTPAWSASSSPAVNAFGSRVAGAGDVNGDGFDDVLVGEANFQGAGCALGRAYLYLGGSAQGLFSVPAWVKVGDGNCTVQASTHFGCSLTGGNFNGDALSDIVVGCARRGSMLFLGTPSGPSINPVWNAENYEARAQNAGDVNGDHLDDLISVFDNGMTQGAAAYIYPGGASGLATLPIWTMQGGQTGSGFGGAIAGAGDTDGDGLANVLIGASNYFPASQAEGAAFLFFGPVVVPCSVDTDLDGYCALGPGTDCDDADPSIHPNAVELCDGLDDDCDGRVDDNIVPPGTQEVQLNPHPVPPGSAEIDWSSDPEAQSYDVVYGDLNGLRASGGDYSTAILGCVAENTPSLAVDVDLVPAPGGFHFYLLRGNNCAGPGTWDSGAPSQVGGRDALIAASPNACAP